MLSVRWLRGARPGTGDVGAYIINPDYGLAVGVVARHHPADVDRHSAPPCMLRQRYLSGLASRSLTPPDVCKHTESQRQVQILPGTTLPGLCCTPCVHGVGCGPYIPSAGCTGHSRPVQCALGSAWGETDSPG